MTLENIESMAHLMRRAGFGASYSELEERVERGYTATVEELLYPEQQPDLKMDWALRHFVEWKEMIELAVNRQYWTYRMVNSPRPLEEKITVFWHGILCTSNSKCEHPRQIKLLLDKFRQFGLGNFATLLLELSRDPAMIFYLDNCMSHKGAVNENFGRELLELFSMGAGMDGEPNYSEEDVFACARAFTGWTITNPIPPIPYSRYDSQFMYNHDDHDDDEKTFLGETGKFNGQDIIEIIAKQPATARFISRHLYNFFVADEPQIPAWQDSPPADLEAIRLLEEEYFRSNYDIRSMLRVLFNSEFFKNARFQKVKSPVELVVGVMKVVGDFTDPKPGLDSIGLAIQYMGQTLLNPPTVEGWHTGQEWIDGGTLVERINFAVDQVGNTSLPGVKSIIDRLARETPVISPKDLIDRCQIMLGGYQFPEKTRLEFISQYQDGEMLMTTTRDFSDKVGQLLQLMVAVQEYQLG